MARVRVALAQAKIDQAMVGSDGMVTQFVVRKTGQVRSRAVLYTPVDTGNLRASITQAITRSGTEIIGLVGSPVEYAEAVHEGQPAGPVRVRAHTVRAHRVRGSRGRKGFTQPSYRKGTYTRQMKGTTGRPFLRRALNDVMG